MGRLTTHVLDTSAGQPAAGIRIELHRLDQGSQLLGEFRTNPDGRLDGPLLEGEDLLAGEYELVFHAAEYFGGRGADRPLFLDQVVIRFVVSEPSDQYHVPLILSPFGYSTYRGS